MAIYTRTGDKGFTMLPGPDGSSLRVRKDDPRMVSLGSLDELNSWIGLCLTAAEAGEDRTVVRVLTRIQDDLFTLGAMLASLAGHRKPDVQLDRAAVNRLERQIDASWAKLGPLKSFLRPGGCELAARLHVARAVTRRAERDLAGAVEVCQHAKRLPAAATLIGRYLNRLSDLLFVLARHANRAAGRDEQTWKTKEH